jgi:hypothetical protein
MIEVYRVTSPQDVQFLEGMITRFHDKVQGLRYTVGWSMQNIAQAAGQFPNQFVLAAWDPERGDYGGYVWFTINPTGEAYIYQAYSQTPQIGRKMDEAVLQYAARYGSHLVDCLVTLQPGEGLQLITAIRRFDYLAKRHGYVPLSVWLTKPVVRSM